MQIQETIARMLKSGQPMTAAECRAKLDEAEARRSAINERIADITGTMGGKPGPVRKAVAETGTPADLLALDGEELLLEAEAESIVAQKDALRARLAVAVKEEAPADAVAALKRLPAALKRAEAAIAARDKALAEIEQLLIAIASARRTAGEVSCPAVSPADFERVAVLLDWHYAARPYRDPPSMKAALIQRRADLTGERPPQPVEPETPWQELERKRQGEIRAKRESYLA